MRFSHPITVLATAFLGLVAFCAFMILTMRLVRSERSGRAISKGYVLAKQGHYKEAIAEERFAVRLDPNSSIAHNNLGFYLFKTNQLQEAEIECREALRLNSHDEYSHDSLGQTLTAMGKTKEAIFECREAVRLQSDKAVYYNSLGKALYGDGQTAAARLAWQQALSVSANDPKEAQEARELLQKTDVVR